MPSKEQVIEVIREVFDPEIPVNVFDLGLIYGIQASDSTVSVEMTLTSQSCPAAGQLPEDVRSRIQNQLGVSDVSVNITFDPPWDPTKISPEGRKILMIDE